MSLHIRTRVPLAAILAFVAAGAGAADNTVDSTVLYRCPGNDYRNTISAKEAEKLGCRKVEGAPITLRSVPPARPS